MIEKRLREQAGCSSLCALSVAEMAVAPIFIVVHNGVSFSRQTRVDRYVVMTNGEAVEHTLAAWLQAHHKGDTSAPFTHELSPGRFVIVPEDAG